MILTNVTLPETQFTRLAQANLANRSFYLRSTLVAFESSDACNPTFIASMPDLGKASTEVARKTAKGVQYQKVKFTVPLKFEKAELKSHRQIAAKVAEGSLSLLLSAALHWQQA